MRSRRQATPNDGRGCVSPSSADHPGGSVSQCAREKERERKSERVRCSAAKGSDAGSCGAASS